MFHCLRLHIVCPMHSSSPFPVFPYFPFCFKNKQTKNRLAIHLNQDLACLSDANVALGSGVICGRVGPLDFFISFCHRVVCELWPHRQKFYIPNPCGLYKSRDGLFITLHAVVGLSEEINMVGGIYWLVLSHILHVFIETYTQNRWVKRSSRGNNSDINPKHWHKNKRKGKWCVMLV